MIEFKIGNTPKNKIPEDITLTTTAKTAVLLTHEGYRGKSLGLDKQSDKEKIGFIKDESDARAKKIYEQIIKDKNIILVIRASEGFARDQVLESFKSNDIIVPDELMSELDEIKVFLETNQEEYISKAGHKYLIQNAITDVVENTNSFVTNAQGKSMQDILSSDAGASSINMIGKGVASIGNIPDYYADTIFTLVPKDKIDEFNKDILDPEDSANDPNAIKSQLQRIAQANSITINDIEVVIMDRARENFRLEVLQELQKEYTGLKITQIKDGTVAHSIVACLGQNNAKHKVVITVSGAAEAFFNLALAGAFKSQGAIGSVRVYSKNVNKTELGDKAKNLYSRYNFDKNEKSRITELREYDYEDILNGNKLFTQDYVKGDIKGSFSFISNNGVFQVPGVEKIDESVYEVVVLRFGNFDNKLYAWYDKKRIKK